MAIKLVFFDYGDCLAKISRREFKIFSEEFFSKRGADASLQNRLWSEFFPLVSNGSIPRSTAEETVFSKLGLTVDDASDWMNADLQFRLSHLNLFPSVKETLSRLKAGGYKLAILSDSVHSEGYRRELLKADGINEFFDAIFQSCDIKAVKPEARAYELVLEHFNVNPSEAVFVAHEKEEIDGAKALGIKTIGFNVKDDSEPDAIANDFSEIPGIIAGFHC